MKREKREREREKEAGFCLQILLFAPEMFILFSTSLDLEAFFFSFLPAIYFSRQFATFLCYLEKEEKIQLLLRTYRVSHSNTRTTLIITQ